jgi:hypothetical protein
VVLALLDPEKDAGAGFRLARGPAHDDACGADLDDTELGGSTSWPLKQLRVHMPASGGSGCSPVVDRLGQFPD